MLPGRCKREPSDLLIRSGTCPSLLFDSDLVSLISPSISLALVSEGREDEGFFCRGLIGAQHCGCGASK